MISPKQAPVKPRVVSPETHEDLLLEDVVESRIALGHFGAIQLTGGPGMGKSTALAHLASRGFADRILLVDDALPKDSGVSAKDRLVVYASRLSSKLTDSCYQLVPWTADDVIEYLLNMQPARCPSVMARFSTDGDRGLLEGNPSLLCLVSTQMAASDEIQSIRSALRHAIAEQAVDEQTLEDARSYAAAMLFNKPDLAEARAREMILRDVPRELIGLLGFRIVQILLCADRMIALLKNRHDDKFLRTRFPRELVGEIARLVQVDPMARDRLGELMDSKAKLLEPTVASILHAVDPAWRPRGHRQLDLSGAYLSGSQWRSIELQGTILAQADLRESDLRDANLDGAELYKATLTGAEAEGASLLKVNAAKANFGQADLSWACLSGGAFRSANFAGADLHEAVATGADFGQANLTRSSLRGATLDGCNFLGASLEAADLQDADLRCANLSRQILRTVNLRGANLEGAKLIGCDLEFVEWPRAALSGANLSKAYLTGSKMAGADFRKATLNFAGLADVDWENADLRLADLTGCSFHMGSSRSGLVGSPYPGHGSRTGFYTDDFDDQSYKAPEEIRKANLCGADLRGALIFNVDFYLVDLRGAIYDLEQRDHLRRCDAILESRTR